MARGYHADVVIGRSVGIGLYEFRVKWVCANVAKNLVFDATNQSRDSDCPPLPCSVGCVKSSQN